MSGTNEADKKFQKELNSGTAALVLLSILRQAREPMYGYQIAKLIESKEREIAIMKQGALYPVLRSLEGNNLLESEVEPSVSGPPRRYYKISGAGRETYEKWKDIWSQTSEFVNSILEEGNDD